MNLKIYCATSVERRMQHIFSKQNRKIAAGSLSAGWALVGLRALAQVVHQKFTGLQNQGYMPAPVLPPPGHQNCRFSTERRHASWSSTSADFGIEQLYVST